MFCCENNSKTHKYTACANVEFIRVNNRNACMKLPLRFTPVKHLCFNVKLLILLPTYCIYEFHIILKINSNYYYAISQIRALFN